jgi:hypothetical protein
MGSGDGDGLRYAQIGPELPTYFLSGCMEMNERIKLPAQEWLGYDPEKGDIHGYTFEQMREFAELIVRECANQCDLLLNHKMSSEWARGTHDCSRAIKKHFGVEE